MRQLFGKYGVIENTRPDWLISSQGERMELDFFIDRLSIAIEVQGAQHLRFTPIFHGTEWGFKQQLRRDREKKEICERAGITLFEIFNVSDIDCVMYSIFAIIDRLQATSHDDDFEEIEFPSLKIVQQEKQLKYKHFRKQFERAMGILHFTVNRGRQMSPKTFKRLEYAMRIINVGIEEYGFDIPIKKEAKRERAFALLAKAESAMARHEDVGVTRYKNAQWLLHKLKGHEATA